MKLDVPMLIISIALIFLGFGLIYVHPFLSSPVGVIISMNGAILFLLYPIYSTLQEIKKELDEINQSSQE